MFLLAGDQRYFEETLPVSELKDLLDALPMSSARAQADRVRGLKWLLAMISKGTDVSRFFPDVIRNIMTNNFELKKLVYMYVLHFADHDEQSRATALLSINAFQRDLSDEHELIRGLALRTLTSVRVKDIAEVQALAIRNCARDISPYVRKIAANSVSKLGARREFEDEVLGVLLEDNSPSVIGSAACAILVVCPHRFDLVHAAFERMCLVLHEVDEFGQVAVLKLMSRYVRHAFVCPTLSETEEFEDFSFRGPPMPAASASKTFSQPPRKRKLPSQRELDSFLDDEVVKEVSGSPIVVVEPAPKQPSIKARPASTQVELHPNHKRLIQLALSLLKSRNSAVVMASAHTVWYCGQRSSSALYQVAQALVRLVKSPLREVGFCALQAVVPLIHDRPTMFAVQDFFVAEHDLAGVKSLKLEVIAFLVDSDTLEEVLGELEKYVLHSDERFASEAVRTVGRVVRTETGGVARDCLCGLCSLVFASVPSRVREEAIGVARDVLARLGATVELTPVLRKFLGVGFTAAGPQGKVHLMWLSRRFNNECGDEAGDVLREAAQSFSGEAQEVKLEALSLAKALQPSEPEVATYVLELGEMDIAVDVRDWARFLRGADASNQPAGVVVPSERKPLPKDPKFEIDSLSFVVGKAVQGYVPLPEWASEPRNFPPPPRVKPQTWRKPTVVDSSSSSEEESGSEESEEESDSNEEESSSSEEVTSTPVVMSHPAVVPTAPPPLISPQAVSLQTTRPAPFILLLSNVRGQGLQVEASFSRLSAPLGWTSVMLRVTNKHLDATFSNIRVERQEGVVESLFDAVPLLAVGFHREDLAMQVNFQGHWRTAVRFTLSSDETGKIPVEIKPPPGELLLADSTCSDFARMKKILGGMNELRVSVVAPQRAAYSLDDIKEVVSKAGNFGFVDFTLASVSSELLDLDLPSTPNSARFAALRCDTMSSRVLVEVSWDAEHVDLCVNCEYALAGQALLEALEGSFNMPSTL